MKKWCWVLLVIGMWLLWPAVTSKAEDVFDWPGLKEATYNPATGVGTVVVPPPEIYALANEKYVSVVTYLTTAEQLVQTAHQPLSDTANFNLRVSLVSTTVAVNSELSVNAKPDIGYTLTVVRLYVEFSFTIPGDYIFELTLINTSKANLVPPPRRVTFHVLADSDLPASAQFILDGQTITSDRVLQIFLRDDQQRIFAPKINGLLENHADSKTSLWPWLTPLMKNDKAVNTVYKVQTEPNMGVTVKSAAINIRTGEILYDLLPDQIHLRISGYYPTQSGTKLSINWSFANLANYPSQDSDNIVIPYSKINSLQVNNISIVLEYSLSNTKENISYMLSVPKPWPPALPVTPTVPLISSINQFSILALNQNAQVFDLNWPGNYQLSVASTKLTVAASQLINGVWTLPFVITFPNDIANANLTAGAEVAISGNDQHLIDFRGTMLRIPRTNRGMAGQYQLTLTITQVSGP